MICCLQYVIKNWTLALVNGSQAEEGIKMELVLKRRIMNAVLTIYLPTALVAMMTLMTKMIMNAVLTIYLPTALVTMITMVTMMMTMMIMNAVLTCPPHC